MKFCNKCQTLKKLSEFGKNSGKKDGLHHCCKACVSIYNKHFYSDNKSHVQRIREKHKDKNSPRVKTSAAAWRKENRDKIKMDGVLYRRNNSEKLLNKNRRYREEHRIQVTAYDREYRKERRAWDLDYRIRSGLRSRLNAAIRGNQKSGSAIRDLGCSIDELRNHLEDRFLPGMSWNNYGKGGWNIDHILPLVGFDLTDRTQFLQACHYTNLQPLWERDNFSKGAKIT